MKNTINIQNYKHNSDTSSYNHNYYHGEGRVILETCNDDDLFMYYEVTEYGNKHLGNYFGTNGIFSDFNDDIDITSVIIDTECT